MVARCNQRTFFSVFIKRGKKAHWANKNKFHKRNKKQYQVFRRKNNISSPPPPPTHATWQTGLCGRCCAPDGGRRGGRRGPATRGSHGLRCRPYDEGQKPNYLAGRLFLKSEPRIFKLKKKWPHPRSKCQNSLFFLIKVAVN